MIRSLTAYEIDFVAGGYCPTPSSSGGNTATNSNFGSLSVGSQNTLEQVVSGASGGVTAANIAGAVGNFLVGGNIISVAVTSSSHK
jgi:hypothetical protein